MCHVCHTATMAHMAHGQPALVLRGQPALVLAVCWLAGRVLTHTTHGQPALVLPALVLRGQRPAASAPAPRPGWQGRAVRATATERMP